MPRRYSSSADMDATVARVAPAVLALLGDGVPLFRGLGYRPLPFRRVSSRPFASGMVLNEYVRS